MKSVVADGQAPAQAGPGPGVLFAGAVRDHLAAGGGGGMTLELAMSLPLTFPFFAFRPRYTVRHLLPVVPASGPRVPYLHEVVGDQAGGLSGTTYGTSPESGFQPAVAHADLTEVTVTVPLPDGLLDLPGLLATFVERRVVVRLGTMENQVMLRGSADGRIPGLLTAGGLRRERGRGDLAPDLARAAALVEETGGSCDGMVAHPDVYWALVASGALDRFGAAGVRIARTRMIERAQVLLGDFRAAASLLDPDRSRLTLHRGGGGDAIEAGVTVGQAVHLPQHLLLLTLP